LAFEKRFNDLLSIGDREDFVEALTRGLPAKPADMLAILRQNQGRTPVEA